MYYYPPQNSAGPGSTPGSTSTGASTNNSNSNYNRGSSPSTNNRETNKNNSSSVGSTSSNASGSNNRNSNNRNVAASYAKGAAIYQPPVYSVPITGPNMQVAQQGQDRAVMNGLLSSLSNSIIC